jgi:hypothetical protein
MSTQAVEGYIGTLSMAWLDSQKRILEQPEGSAERQYWHGMMNAFAMSIAVLCEPPVGKLDPATALAMGSSIAWTRLSQHNGGPS